MISRYIVENNETFVRYVESGNILWDANHFQPASTLTPEEAMMFGVYELTEVQPPTYDANSQKIVELDPAPVNGVWTQQWQVVDLPAEEVAALAVAKVANLKTAIADATQERLDAFAKTRNYDGILSACTYAGSGVTQFAAEGQYCIGVRDQTWAALYTLLAEVQAGARPMPAGFADIEPLLPVLAWP